MAVALIAGCTSDDTVTTTTEDGSDSPTTVAASPTTAAPSTTSPGGTVDPDATITVAYNAGFNRFDPRFAGSAADRVIDLSIYENLVVVDYFHPENPLAVVPGLATDWSISDDGLTYTFTLREGVTFHDGSPFDAEAVEFSFRTIIDPEFEFFCADCNAASARDNSKIADVRATGDYEVELELVEPFGPFLETLATQSWFAIVSPTAIETYGNEGLNEHPTGTGYLKYSEYVPDQSLTLVRNDDYWQGPVAYSTIVFRPITDPVSRASAIEAGEVDIALDLSPDLVDAWATAEGFGTVVRGTPRIYSCQLNYRGDSPVNDIKVREALSLAIDREGISQAVYGGESKPAHGWFTDSVPPFDPDSEALEYDITRAASLLEEAGYADGMSLRVDISPYGPGDPDIVAIWQASLREIGVELEVQTLDLATWVDQWLAGLDPETGPDGVCLQYGQDLLWGIVNYNTEVGATPPGAFNTGNYHNELIEDLAAQGRAATSLEEYYDILRQIDRELTSDFGMLFFQQHLQVHGKSDLVDWQPSAGIFSLYFNAVKYQP